MTKLQTAIDAAVEAQYPNKKISEKDKWVMKLDQQLEANGFKIVPRGTSPARFTQDYVPGAWNIVEQEFRFHPERMWRFDRVITFKKIAIELDGGSFGRVVQCGRCKLPVYRTLKDGRSIPIREGGRHNTGAGMQSDHEKQNAAVALGWWLLKFTPQHIKDGYAVNLIKQMALSK